MTFEELEIEIDFIMNLSEENLKETSTEDLLNYRKKLKRNCEKIKNLRELKNNRIIDFNANNIITFRGFVIAFNPFSPYGISPNPNRKLLNALISF